jgi:hypothetical protein
MPSDLGLTAVKVTTLVLCVATPCGLEGRNQRFGESLKVGDSMFLRNDGFCLETQIFTTRKTNNDVKCYVDKYLCDVFRIQNGVKQGYTLSSLLFCIALDYVCH